MKLKQIVEHLVNELVNEGLFDVIQQYLEEGNAKNLEAIKNAAKKSDKNHLLMTRKYNHAEFILRKAREEKNKIKEEIDLDEGNKLNKMLKNLHARKTGGKKMRDHGSPELNRIAALKKGREILKNSYESPVFDSVIEQYVVEAIQQLVSEGLFDNLKTQLQKQAGLPTTPEEKAQRDKKIEANWAARVKAQNPPKPINPQGFTFYKELENPSYNKPIKAKPVVSPIK